MKKLLSIILMASMIVTLTPIACGGGTDAEHGVC
jgi:hypothetical protein